MYDFDSTLKRVIIENRRVIVPDLGAFIKNDDKPVFSALLKYNDGFLEEQLQKEGVADPAKLIKSFVEDVKYVTDEGQQFHIDGLGYFYSEDNNLQFYFENWQETPAVVASAPVNDTQPTVTEKPQKENKGKFWVIFAAICLAIIALGAAYFFLLKPNSAENELKPIISQTEKPENQFTLSDSTANKTAGKPETEPVATSPNLEFHVIAGCFEEKINAENFVAQCKKWGYKNAQILSKISDLYPVSIESFATMSEAVAAQEKYDDKYEEDTWVYRVK